MRGKTCLLKGGCAIKKLQKRSIDKTITFILMYSIIAVMILNMTYAARLTPELPCSLLPGEDEWKLLYCMVNKTKKGPKKPYTINEAVDCSGRPGGPKRAPRDGPRGVKTIWLGLMKLYILLAYREYLA
jgi:hypothetical protein